MRHNCFSLLLFFFVILLCFVTGKPNDGNSNPVDNDDMSTFLNSDMYTDDDTTFNEVIHCLSSYMTDDLHSTPIINVDK